MTSTALFEFADKGLVIDYVSSLQSELSTALKLLRAKKCEYVESNSRLMRMGELLSIADNNSESEIDQNTVSTIYHTLFRLFSATTSAFRSQQAQATAAAEGGERRLAPRNRRAANGLRHVARVPSEFLAGTSDRFLHVPFVAAVK